MCEPDKPFPAKLLGVVTSSSQRQKANEDTLPLPPLSLRSPSEDTASSLPLPLHSPSFSSLLFASSVFPDPARLHAYFQISLLPVSIRSKGKEQFHVQIAEGSAIGWEEQGKRNRGLCKNK